MPQPKGSTGNPNGRPPKGRALTALLERALAETRQLPEAERKVAGKALLARYVVDALLTGKLPYQVTVMVKDLGPVAVDAELNPGQWVDLAKFVYGHVDGPLPTQVQSDGTLRIVVEYADDAHPDLAPLAWGAAGSEDSRPPL